MLDLKWIRDNQEALHQGIQKKGDSVDVDALLNQDKALREILAQLEEKKCEMNANAKEIGHLKSKGQDPTEKMKGMKELSEEISTHENRVRELRVDLEKILYTLPNLPDESVPVGKTDEDNVEIKSWGEKKSCSFKVKPHWEIGESLDILDLKRSSKISGSGFICLKGHGALLERALINFMLDLHVVEHGYTEIWPPLLVNRESMIGTGQLPKMEEDMYKVSEDGLFLIPTAEVPLTNLFGGEVFSEKNLPHTITAYTPCFRREAGTYGKETRGIIRVHQFDKVELVRFVHPEKSYDELEILLGHAESVLQRLGIHYRVRLLCSGDLSFAAAKCYDIEAWAPAQNAYLEVSSCSNFEDFQARRANIRFKGTKGKSAYLHTLNGSGVALARTLVVLLESYQREDGSIDIPEVLWPYTRGIKRIKPNRN